MQSGTEINAVAHVIQQAVAPVFLLTGVGAILGVLTNRLARIIDRARSLDALLVEVVGTDKEHHSAQHRHDEMDMLGRRRKWIHVAISLCTICALLVCLVIATLFIASEVGSDPSRVVGMLFVAAMLSLIAGLCCFLREISLATEQYLSR